MVVRGVVDRIRNGTIKSDVCMGYCEMKGMACLCV